MQSRIILGLCTIAVLLLMVSSSVIVADDQYHPRVRKVPGGWLSAHQFQPQGKRGRFVFRDAPNAHLYETANDGLLVDSDAQDSDSNLDKRNWRL